MDFDKDGKAWMDAREKALAVIEQILWKGKRLTLAVCQKPIVSQKVLYEIAENRKRIEE